MLNLLDDCIFCFDSMMKFKAALHLLTFVLVENTVLTMLTCYHLIKLMVNVLADSCLLTHLAHSAEMEQH